MIGTTPGGVEGEGGGLRYFLNKLTEVQPMWCVVIGLFPATFFLVVSYFVLYTSIKTEGFVSWFGQLLALWLLIVALAFPVYGLLMERDGMCPVTTVPMLVR
jgi:hypothetical protein